MTIFMGANWVKSLLGACALSQADEVIVALDRRQLALNKYTVTEEDSEIMNELWDINIPAGKYLITELFKIFTSAKQINVVVEPYVFLSDSNLFGFKGRGSSQIVHYDRVITNNSKDGTFSVILSSVLDWIKKEEV